MSDLNAKGTVPRCPICNKLFSRQAYLDSHRLLYCNQERKNDYDSDVSQSRDKNKNDKQSASDANSKTDARHSDRTIDTNNEKASIEDVWEFESANDTYWNPSSEIDVSTLVDTSNNDQTTTENTESIMDIFLNVGAENESSPVQSTLDLDSERSGDTDNNVPCDDTTNEDQVSSSITNDSFIKMQIHLNIVMKIIPTYLSMMPKQRC